MTITPDELGNPGDTSLESANAFNKRVGTIPATEQLWIDNPDLPGPDQDGPDTITNDDRPPRRVGDEAHTSSRQFLDKGWTTIVDRELPEEA